MGNQLACGFQFNCQEELRTYRFTHFRRVRWLDISNFILHEEFLKVLESHRSSFLLDDTESRSFSQLVFSVVLINSTMYLSFPIAKSGVPYKSLIIRWRIENYFESTGAIVNSLAVFDRCNKFFHKPQKQMKKKLFICYKFTSTPWKNHIICKTASIFLGWADNAHKFYPPPRITTTASSCHGTFILRQIDHWFW